MRVFYCSTSRSVLIFPLFWGRGTRVNQISLSDRLNHVWNRKQEVYQMCDVMAYPRFSLVLCVFLSSLSRSLNSFISCGVTEFMSTQRTMPPPEARVATWKSSQIFSSVIERENRNVWLICCWLQKSVELVNWWHMRRNRSTRLSPANKPLTRLISELQASVTHWH